MLEARDIPAGDGRLQSDAVGEVEVEGGVLVIKRMRVRHRLRVASGADRHTIERVYELHTEKCPVARSIGGCVDISTELELEDE